MCRKAWKSESTATTPIGEMRFTEFLSPSTVSGQDRDVLATMFFIPFMLLAVAPTAIDDVLNTMAL